MGGTTDAMRDARAGLLRGQLVTKFGRLPKWVDGRLDAASSATVERWSKKILSAETLEGVLGRQHPVLQMGSPTDLYQNEFVQEVIRQALARILRGQLALKFGRLPKWVDERLQAASALQLQRWSISILTAGALEGVFGKKPHRTML
jgi:hypothetical protein